VEDIFRMYGQLVSMIFKVSWALSKMLVQGTARAGSALSGAVGNHVASRGPRRGILAPGDPPPPPNAPASYYDYRGVLAMRSVPQELQDAEFPLGRHVYPGKGLRQPIGLPEPVVGHHVGVVGPPGSGKTSRIIIPWMSAALRAGWSVVVIDVKGDLLDQVKESVRRSGQPIGVKAVSLDYTRPARSVKWNWLDEMDSNKAIDNAVKAIIGKEEPKNADPFYYRNDSRILRGMLELASISPRRDTVTATRLLELLTSQARLDRLLSRNTTSPAYKRLEDLLPLDPGDYAKRVSGVVAALDALANPVLEQVTNEAQVHASDVLYSPTLVSVVAPLQDGDMASMLSSLFVSQLLFRAYDRFANPGGVPVLLVLDEARQLKDRVDIQSFLAVARQAQVAGLVAVQDVMQFDDPNERSSIFGNCSTLIYLPQTSQASADLLSKRLGQHPVQATSTSRSPSPSGWGTQTSHSMQTQMVPVLGEREIMQLPFGRFAAVVHSRQISDHPFIVDLEHQL
jgi:type IV secretory pathway TraG/TraD family ATPase VirD4